jgi:hypothetical protein
MTTGNAKVVLTDLNGKVLSSQLVAEQETVLDLSIYTPGVYIVTIQTGDQVLTQRIVKQ